MGEIKQQTLSGVKWTAIERFSIQGVQFLLGIVVARLLTPADYGLVGLLGIFLGISQTLIDSGISNALVRKLDRDEADFSTAFYFNIAVATGCAAAIFFGSPWIAHFFKQPELSPIAKLYSVNLIIGAFGMVQGAKLTIEVDFKTQARINFISAVVSGIICLVLAYLGWGVWSLVWQSIISNVMRVILLWTSTKWKPLLLFSKKSFNNLFGYGSKLMASGLLHTVYSELTTIAIGKFYTPAALGNYYRGQGMSSLPVNMITGMFGRVTFPIFSRIQNDDERLIRVYRNYISSVMMLVVFFCNAYSRTRQATDTVSPYRQMVRCYNIRTGIRIRNRIRPHMPTEPESAAGERTLRPFPSPGNNQENHSHSNSFRSDSIRCARHMHIQSHIRTDCRHNKHILYRETLRPWILETVQRLPALFRIFSYSMCTGCNPRLSVSMAYRKSHRRCHFGHNHISRNPSDMQGYSLYGAYPSIHK